MNEELRTSFERHCREHLLDERAVMEAWILRFLEASQEERQATAKRYADWLAERRQATPKHSTSAFARRKRKA